MHFSPKGNSVLSVRSSLLTRWRGTYALAVGLVPVVCGMAWSHEPLSAPEPARAPAPRPSAKEAVALIDLKHVFDHYPGFVRAKAELQIDMQLSETMVALRKASVEKLQKDRRRHAPGTDAYRQLSQLLSSETAELEAQVEALREQFVRQQAELYHEAYRRIQEVVDAYVEEKGLSVVLRFNRAEVADAGDAKEVAVLLNRPIVAYKKPADITDEVLRRLEKAPALEVARRPKNASGTK